MLGKRVFICAPIIGHDIKERRKFFKDVSQKVKKQGYCPVNTLDAKATDKMTIKELMRELMLNLLSCDYILLCDGWQRGVECQKISTVALWCGIDVLSPSKINL